MREGGSSNDPVWPRERIRDSKPAAGLAVQQERAERQGPGPLRKRVGQARLGELGLLQVPEGRQVEEWLGQEQRRVEGLTAKHRVRQREPGNLEAEVSRVREQPP